MHSIPPATAISDSPRVTAWAARATALRPEPQALLMVMAATRGAQPPLRAACRAGFWPRPAWTTLPRMASSICLASRPARRMASATILPPSSGADKLARPPWNLPMGVRTAERMTRASMEDLHMKYQYIGCGRVELSYEEKQRHSTEVTERAPRCA